MATLLLAEHDNKTLAPATAKALDVYARIGPSLEMWERLADGDTARGCRSWMSRSA